MTKCNAFGDAFTNSSVSLTDRDRPSKICVTRGHRQVCLLPPRLSLLPSSRLGMLAQKRESGFIVPLIVLEMPSVPGMTRVVNVEPTLPGMLLQGTSTAAALMKKHCLRRALLVMEWAATFLEIWFAWIPRCVIR